MSLKPPAVGTSSATSYFDELARKPTTTTRFQYVDADAGSDANDGRSWGSAKLTLANAVATLTNGGHILVASASAEYNVTATLTLAGHTIEAVHRSSGGTQGLAVIRHKFNGDLFSFGANGGALKNLLLYEDDVTTGRTGAAIKATSSASAGGFIQCENLVISGGDGWERDVVLDGSAWTTFGIRKVEFLNCQFFGARTAGETIKITRGVHCKFLGGFVDPAPTAVTQGIKLIDTGTTDVQFANFELIGDFYTEAAGGRCTYTGGISGTITCTASSGNNAFFIASSTASTPAWANAGDDKNTIQGPTRYANITAAASLTVPGAAEVLMVNGTTGPITSIVATGMGGRRLTLVFSNATPPQVTDGSNLLLAGNFVTTQWDTLTLVSDGTNWYECSRSAN